MAIIDQSRSKRWWARPPWAFILKFVGLSLIFLIGHYLFETSSIGKDFKMFESEVLRTMLDISHDPEYVPIIVNIAPIRSADTPTNRKLLDELIRKLNSMGVRAVGVDIDFSPLDSGQPVTPEDWNYFQEWLNLTQKGVAKPTDAQKFKLRLGVYRRATDPPENWLGQSDFQSLAAGIASPAGDAEHNFGYVSSAKDKKVRRRSGLLPMAVALSEDVGTHLPDSLFPEDSNQKSESLYMARYLIDYSGPMLRQLASQTIDYYGPNNLVQAEANRRVKFAGKVVLIGDATGLEDQFCRPFSQAPIAGVIAHAASLATLRQGGLREIGDSQTAFFDLVAVAFGCLLLLIYYFWPSRSRSDEAAVNMTLTPTPNVTQEAAIAPAEAETAAATKTHDSRDESDTAGRRLNRLETLYCILAACLIGTGGLLFVHLDNIFWPDFFWTALVLFIHPFVSETFFPFFGGLAAEISRMFRRALLDPEGASHAL